MEKEEKEYNSYEEWEKDHPIKEFTEEEKKEMIRQNREENKRIDKSKKQILKYRREKQKKLDAMTREERVAFHLQEAKEVMAYLDRLDAKIVTIEKKEDKK